MSKCDDDDDDDGDGEPECLQKDDDDDQYDETSGVNDGFRNPDGEMDYGNDGDGEFPNVIVDADGEHDNDEAASDVHIIDADGVFQNEIEDVHSLIHTSGCEDDEGVATDVDDIGDEKEVDTNFDGLVLRRSKHLAFTKNTFRYTKLWLWILIHPFHLRYDKQLI